MPTLLLPPPQHFCLLSPKNIRVKFFFSPTTLFLLNSYWFILGPQALAHYTLQVTIYAQMTLLFLTKTLFLIPVRWTGPCQQLPLRQWVLHRQSTRGRRSVLPGSSFSSGRRLESEEEAEAVEESGFVWSGWVLFFVCFFECLLCTSSFS